MTKNNSTCESLDVEPKRSRKKNTMNYFTLVDNKTGLRIIYAFNICRNGGSKRK